MDNNSSASSLYIQGSGCRVSWEKLFNTSSKVTGNFEGQKVIALNHILCTGSFRLVLCQVCFKFQLYVGFERKEEFYVYLLHTHPQISCTSCTFVCGGLFWFFCCLPPPPALGILLLDLQLSHKILSVTALKLSTSLIFICSCLAK